VLIEESSLENELSEILRFLGSRIPEKSTPPDVYN
jgi:hypothetical protein